MKKLIHLSIAAQVFLHTAPCASSQKRLAAFRSRTRPYVAPSGDRYRPLSAGRTEFCQAAAMKKVTSFIILIFLYLSTFAQEVDLPQVFSPNAAEIGRYGKVPVSYFTGLPQIEIPLIPLKTKEGDWPLKMSYRADGHKPDIQPGWTGLGWTLLSGGCINRIVNGYKDEIDEVEDGLVGDPLGYLYNCHRFRTTDPEDETQMRQIYNSGGVVMEGWPDEFQVNLPGISASFFVTGYNTGTGACEIKIQSRNPDYFRVDSLILYRPPHPYMEEVFRKGAEFLEAATYTHIKLIQITDSQGIIYRFGGDDTSIEFTYDPTGDPITMESAAFKATANTWMLREVLYPSGERITFSYKKDGFPVVVRDIHHSYTLSRRWGVSYGESTRDGTNYRKNINFTFLRPSYLTEVCTFISRDTIRFATSQARGLKSTFSDQDFYCRAIREETLSAAGSIVLQDFRDSDYFLKLDSIITRRGTVRFQYRDHSGARTRLSSLHLTGEGCTPLVWSMYYNDDNDLPAFNSRETDNWGYYNGKYYGNIVDFNYLSAYRTADDFCCQAETLSSLTYPTGGSSSFEYELNDWSRVQDVYAPPGGRIRTSGGQGGGLRISRIRDYDGHQWTSRRFYYTDIDGNSSGVLNGEPHYIASGSYSDQGGEYSQHFWDVFENVFSQTLTYGMSDERGIAQIPSTDGRMVTYDRVVEMYDDGSSISYSYTNVSEYPDAADGTLMTNVDNILIKNPVSSREVCRGLLKEKAWRDHNGSVKRKEENRYEIDTTDYVNAFFMGNVCSYIRRLSCHRIYTCYPELKQRIVRTFPEIGSTSLIETTEYSYDNYRNMSSRTRFVRNSPKDREEFKYSGNLGGQVYTAMIAAGQVGIPIERKLLRDGLLISAEMLSYDIRNGMFLPYRHHLASLGAGKDPSYIVSTGYMSVHYGPPDIIFHQYDSHGNPLQVHLRAGWDYSWTWDADGMYPLSRTTTGLSSLLSLTDGYFWDKKHRGLLSHTHPNTLSTSYSYDSLGRLTDTWDYNGDRVSHYEYDIASSTIKTFQYNDDLENDYSESYVRYDGLGRRKSEVLKYAGGTDKDLVTWQEYDACYRPSKEWLPAAIPTSFVGLFREAFRQYSNQSYSDSSAYYRSVYNGTPQERLRKTFAPGQNWHRADKGIRRLYGANESGNNALPELICDSLCLAASGDSLVLTYGGIYSGGTFSVEQSEDEDGNIHLSFADLNGNPILERDILDSEEGNGVVYADTYYIYDTAGRLLMVSPPELSKRVKTANWNNYYSSSGWRDVANYTFRYEYDDKNRCIAKKLPGADWIYYVYDTDGLFVLSQDGNQRLRNEWSFKMTDRLGRECIKGVFTTGNEVSQMRSTLAHSHVYAEYNGSPGNGGYTISNIPSFMYNAIEPLEVTWWDNYSFRGKVLTQDGNVTFDPALYKVGEWAGEPCTAIHSSAAGLVTGKMCRLMGDLPDSSVTGWHKTVYYYDERDNLSRKIDGYGNGCIVRETVEYDFRELPVRRFRLLNPGTTGQMTEGYQYTYDRWGRPLMTTHSLNGDSPVKLKMCSYDSLGRLSSFATDMNPDVASYYTYNTRGWLTDISGTLFSEHLYYETPRDTSSVPCWSGNISSIAWRSDAPVDSLTVYDFTYDRIYRLTRADRSGAGPFRGYDRTYSYDLNGNIEEVNGLYLAGVNEWRRGCFAFSKTGNQLSSFSHHAYRLDGTSPSPPRYYSKEYEYDANGNLSSRFAIWKGLGTIIHFGPTEMAIDYNVLNQPIHRWNSSAEEWMVYDALGEKQALYHTTYTQTDTTSCKIEYVGNYVFKDGNLALIQFDGGYLDYDIFSNEDTAAGYCWYLKDHLGNNRVVVDGIGTIVAVNDYDPYGSTPGEMENELTETDGSFTMDGTLWKYGGKERSESFRDYDFDARRYSTGLLRFTTMDPLSEKYYNLSPYTYCAGNPVRYVDPTGRSTWVYENEDGTYTVFGGDINDDDYNVYVYSKDNNGEYVIRGDSIGKTTSLTSFYSFDNKTWAVGAIIDMQNNSGWNFLNDFVSSPPDIITYMINATNNKKYDFKVTNGDNTHQYSGIEHYRGMPLWDGIITSARDVGNIAAGYIAGYNGIPYSASRFAFDFLQTYTDNKISIEKGAGFVGWKIEEATTRNAQFLGWRLGIISRHRKIYGR